MLARPSIHMLNKSRVTFVFNFLFIDFRNFKIAQPCPRHMLCIHVSRDYFISINNKYDSPRAEAGNYQMNENQNHMDGQTESRKVWRFEGKIQFQKTKTERQK